MLMSVPVANESLLLFVLYVFFLSCAYVLHDVAFYCFFLTS